MNFKKITLSALLIFAVSIVLLAGCTVKYSLSGASIHPDAKTISIAYFPNNASMVSPILSPTFTDAMKDKFSRQTRLASVNEDGDLSFEGEIVGYSSTPSAITSNNGVEQAAKNKLTITVKVRFKNKLEPEYDFDRTFSAFLEYNSSDLLQNVEGQLIPEIVDMLVNDIFMAAVSNW